MVIEDSEESDAGIIERNTGSEEVLEAELESERLRATLHVIREGRVMLGKLTVVDLDSGGADLPCLKPQREVYWI